MKPILWKNTVLFGEHVASVAFVVLLKHSVDDFNITEIATQHGVHHTVN